MLRSELTSKLREGHDVLLNVDVQGAATIKKQAEGDPELRRALVSVFLTPPSLKILEDRLKLRGAEGKFLLKQALEPLLPREVLYRPKQGFAASPAATFRAQAGRLRERLLGEPMTGSGLFDRTAVARLIDEHEARAFDHGAALWLLLVFEGFLASEAQTAVPLAA